MQMSAHQLRIATDSSTVYTNTGSWCILIDLTDTDVHVVALVWLAILSAEHDCAIQHGDGKGLE